MNVLQSRCCFHPGCSGLRCVVEKPPVARSLSSAFFGGDVLDLFGQHAETLRVATRQRRESVQLRNVVNDKSMQEAISVEESLGKRQPGDEFSGDVNLRTLRSLLSIIDGRGFERCELLISLVSFTCGPPLDHPLSALFWGPFCVRGFGCCTVRLSVCARGFHFGPVQWILPVLLA